MTLGRTMVSVVGPGLLCTLAACAGENSTPAGSNATAPTEGASLAPSTTTTTPSTAKAAASSSPIRDGVYEVDRHLENTTGCNGASEPSKAAVKCFFLRTEMTFGAKITTMGASDDIEVCRRSAKGEQLGLSRITVFSAGLDTPTPSGQVGGSALVEGGLCKNAKAEYPTMEQLEGGRLHIEIRRVVISYLGKDLSDCSTGDTLKAAVGKPCSGLTVIEGHWTQAIE